MADPQLFLVVKVLDTHYAAVGGVQVFASFDDQPRLLLTPGRDVGLHSVPFTFPATRVRVTINHPGFVPIDQPLKVNRPALTFQFDGPASRPEGAQDINVRNLAVHNRDEGDGINLEVFAILNRLFDGQNQVNLVNLGGRADLRLNEQPVSEISTPMLDPKAAVILSKSKPVKPSGRLFFAQRVTTTAAKLVGIFVPQSVIDVLKEPGRDKQALTLPYHIFFHPRVEKDPNDPKKFTGDYPLSFDYVKLLEKYMLMPIRSATDEALLGKQLVHQHEAGTKRPVFVFPVGGLKDQMGDLPTPGNVIDLLFDINYWVQRMLKVSFPLVPGESSIAKLAVSGFSFGIRHVSRLFDKAAKGSEAANAQRRLLDNLLKEVYIFDGVFSGPTGQAETENFCRALLTKWFRNGDQSRVIRLYTTSELWMTQLGPAIAASPTVKGLNGSEEREGPGGTALLVPTEFWKSLLTAVDTGLETRIRDAARTATLKKLREGKITAGQVPAEIEKSVKFQFFKIAHQIIPARFPQHAVANQKT